MATFISERALRRAALVLAAFALAIALISPHPAGAQTLTLEDAFRRAAAADPSFSAADARIDAAQSAIRQAGLRPNPSLSLELEDFVGTGAIGAFDRSVTTLGYSQLYERGNKREARTAVARANLDAVELQRQVHALDLFERVETAFVAALAAEGATTAAEEWLASVRRLEAETERRIRAARESDFAGARAAAMIAEAEIAVLGAEAQAAAMKQALAAQWNGAADFELDPFALVDLQAPEFSVTEDNPDLALRLAQRQAAGALVTLEEARAIQDPTFEGGLRHFAIGGDVGLVAGFSIPLPLHDDNSSNISRALAEREAADHEYAAIRRDREREIAILRAHMEAYRAEADRLENALVPEAERARDLAYETFERGALDYNDVVVAERTLNDARRRQLEVDREYRLALVRLHRLTARHMNSLVFEELRP